jgi:hypothetical protein
MQVTTYITLDYKCDRMANATYNFKVLKYELLHFLLQGTLHFFDIYPYLDLSLNC